MAFVPVSALALDYSDYSKLYTDAPFIPAEAAGISLLTSIGAVEGNPDGSFRANRTLNRAEFLKIVLESHPDIRVSASDARNCFPDVWKDAWFSPYVCLAHKRNIVAGYPDGNFWPENSVNYAEALKILGELYNYTAYADEDAPWYEVYAQAARNHKTELPVNIPYDRELTRGQMARLAAAYLAEHEEELSLYRIAEAGSFPIAARDQSSSQESSASSVSSAAASVSSETASSAQSEPEATIEPASSHLLQIGSRTPLIADARFSTRGEKAYIRQVRVELNREIQSIDMLHLVSPTGEDMGDLKLDIYDAEDETWKVSFDKEEAYILGSTMERFGIAATLKGFNLGGVTEELVDVSSITLIVQEVESGQSYEVQAVGKNYPEHQTTFGEITGVRNALGATGAVIADYDSLVGSFEFSGTTVSVANLKIEHLAFDTAVSFGIAATNWEVGAPGSNVRHACSVEEKTRINCLDIPVSLGSLQDGTTTLSLYADLQLGGTEPGRTIQVMLHSAGAMGQHGAVRWSDGTGHFTWVELPEPLAVGTVFEVTPR